MGTGERTLRIALVFSYSLDYCRGVMRGIRDYAQSRRNWVFTPVDPESWRLGATLAELRPAGVIAHIYTQAIARTLGRLRRPVVNVCGVLPGLRFPRVGLDDECIGQLAAEHLLERGLRHLAFVGHRNHSYSNRREAGFRAALGEANGALMCYHERAMRFDPRGRLWALSERVRQWVLTLPKPVGIFACNDVWGVQIGEICRQTNLSVPDDVAIVGVDNDDLLCELARPSLSSVAVPAERIGFEAAAMLDRSMGHAPASAPAPAPAPSSPLLLPPVGVVTRQSSDLLAIEDADVAAAVRIIRQRAHEPITVEDVLRDVPLSRRSLERRFRRILNRGIWEEIRRSHIQRAKDLLTQTQLPMSQVARRTGFTDGKQLSAIFHQETGMTPTAYRRQVQ